MPNQRLDKEPLYHLCNFLTERRLQEIGIDNPITIQLQDFRHIFPGYATVSNQQIERIKTELLRLASETLVSLKILSPEILENFEDNFNQNLPITLSYQRQNIEDYVRKLKIGDIKIEQDANYDKLIFNATKKRFEYQGKVMKLRKNERTKSIRLNLCFLLYGMPLTYTNQDDEQVDIYDDQVYTDYEIGDRVHFDALKNLILERGDSADIRRMSASQYKQITDAISGLNKDADKKLGTVIFDHEDQEVWITRP